MRILTGLFVSFSLIGLGAYGGGLVTIPLIQHELVEQRQWMEFDDMARILAVAQMTPGPIAVNAATFTGFRLGSVPGAIVATASVIFPSLLILVALAPFAGRFKHNSHVRKLRKGIQLGVLSLIIFAVWSYGSGVVQGLLELSIAAAAFLFLVIFEGKLHPLVVILSCGALGALIF